MKVEKASEKLKILEESLGVPVKLSEDEKDKFKGVFEGLKDWLDGTHDVVIEKDRDEAYRYLRLLLATLAKVDVDFIGGVIPPTKIGEDVLLEVAPIEEEPLKPVIRPTKEQVNGWIDQMTPEIRMKATTLLDCLKQYLDPESEVGIDIICNVCSLEKMERCIRDEDPTITDSMTVFMDFQQAGSR